MSGKLGDRKNAICTESHNEAIVLIGKSLEDCPLDEDEDAFQGLGEEDEEIDQFNDDTFGSGAVDISLRQI